MKRLIFLLGFLLLATSAEAVTKYVKSSCTNGITTYNATTDTCTGGSSTVYNTIQNGLNSALAAGDILEIRAGTYNQQLTNSGIGAHSGTSFSNPITVRAHSGETVTINGRLELLRPDQLSGQLNEYWIWQELHIDATGLLNEGVYAGQAHNRFLNVEVKNVGAGQSNPAVNAGVAVAGAFNEFIGCKVHDNGNTPGVTNGTGAPYGFYDSSPDTLIDGCEIYRNGGYGVHGYSSAGLHQRATYRNNKLWDNAHTVTNQASCSLLASAGDGHKIYNNVLWATENTGFLNGICVDSSVGSVIENNTVHNQSRSGISTGGGLGGATSTQVTNNIVSTSRNGFPNIDDSIGIGSTFANNLCFGSGGTSNCQITGQDPLFTDAASNNFLPLAGSPVIDAGTPLSATFSTDIVNTSRPQAAQWDIGAYEAVSGSSPALILALSLDSAPGNVVTDSSGFANDGTLSGSVTTTISGKYNGGLTFSGGQVTIPNSSSLSSISSAFTLQMWVKPTTIDNTYRAIVTKSGVFFLFATSSGTACGNNAIYGGFIDSLGNVKTVCYGTPLTASVFAHVALTYDGATLTLYKDGASVATAAATGTVASNSNSVLVGNSTVNESFAGVGDEMRIYTYARSLAQIVTDRDSSINTLIALNPPIKLHANAAAIKCAALAACLKLGQ